jgi:hypothetical protein
MLGIGASMHKILSDKLWISPMFVLASVLYLLLLYLLDAFLWQGSTAVGVRRASMLVIFLEICGAVFASAAAYPPAPPCLFIVLQYLLFYTYGKHLGALKALRAKQFLLRFSSFLIASSAAVFAWWLLWVFFPHRIGYSKTTTNLWEPSLQSRYAADIGCAGSDDDIDADDNCSSAAFLLWFSPVLVVVTNIATAATGIVVANSEGEGDLTVLIASFGGGALLLWLGASFSSLGSDLSLIIVCFSVVIMFASISLVLGAALADNEMDNETTSGALGNLAKVHSQAQSRINLHAASLGLRKCVSNDWAKATVVFVCLPLLPLATLLSMGNQFVRKCLPAIVGPDRACTKMLHPRVDQRLYLTLAFHSHMTHASSQWEWTSILHKLMTLAAFVTVVVGVGRLTTLLLSALNVFLSSFQLVEVLVIYMFVGLGMFLNPVVPGEFTAPSAVISPVSRLRVQ